MKTYPLLFLAALLVLCAGPASAVDYGKDIEPTDEHDDEPRNISVDSADSRFTLNINNRLQARLFNESFEEAPSKESFDLNRYKLLFTGRIYEKMTYRLQLDLAGGSEDDINLLEDAFVHYAFRGMAQLRVGQMRTFFGRQWLITSGRQQFVDRSIAAERFSTKRDVGVAVMGQNAAKTYAYQIGFFSGHGINRDEDDNRGFLTTARLTFNIFGDNGPFELDETPFDRPGPQLQLGIAAMSNTVGTEDIEEERIVRGGFEVAFRMNGFSLNGEFYTESTDPLFEQERDTDGWYLQAGYYWAWAARAGFEVALRYSLIHPETPSGLTSRDVEERGVAFNWYITPFSHRHKLQFDFRRLTVDNDSFLDRDVARLQLQVVF